MSAELRGADQFRARLEQLAREMPRQVGRALYEEALAVQRESMRRCPVAPDGGALRASHETHQPVITPGEISVSITVGGPSEPYARSVHEHLSEHSPPSWQAAEAAGRPVQWNVGGPKFLESAVLEAGENLDERLAKRLDLFEGLGD